MKGPGPCRGDLAKETQAKSSRAARAAGVNGLRDQYQETCCQPPSEARIDENRKIFLDATFRLGPTFNCGSPAPQIEKGFIKISKVPI